MRRLLRSTPLKTVGRSSQPAYNPEANNQKLKNWSNRLNNLSSSQASKVYLGQLGALVNYYNRISNDETKQINWSEWSARITTPGLVQQVKENYNQQAGQDYDVDKILTDVFSRDSKAIDEINSEMAFHTAIWVDNYLDYVVFLNDLSTISSPTDYNPVEWLDLHSGVEARADALVETHSYLPGNRDDVDLWGYMSKQFAWGKKIQSFYRHPTEDFKDGKATKNVMGR